MAEKEKEVKRSTPLDKVLSAIGILLCVILIPILVVNCILLFKGYTNSDEVPSIGGVFPMIVLSDSMYPEFSSGDLIICRKTEAADVEVGDVIAYYDPMGTGTSVVSHRVIDITEEDGVLYFQTKGDYNNAADTELISEEDLIGVYTGVTLAGVGNVALFMQTIPGLIVCVLIPILLLVGYDIIRRHLYEKKHSAEKEQLLEELEELRRLKEEQQDISKESD